MAMAVAYSLFGNIMTHENRGGTLRAYVADTLGSVTALLDSTGAPTYEAEYWPFGELQSESGANVSPWKFGGVLGYCLDSLSELYYIRARHYGYKTGQWITRDLMWPSEPAYAYVKGQPIGRTDPTGLGMAPPEGTDPTVDPIVKFDCVRDWAGLKAGSCDHKTKGDCPAGWKLKSTFWAQCCCTWPRSGGAGGHVFRDRCCILTQLWEGPSRKTCYKILNRQHIFDNTCPKSVKVYDGPPLPD